MICGRITDLIDGRIHISVLVVSQKVMNENTLTTITLRLVPMLMLRVLRKSWIRLSMTVID